MKKQLIALSLISVTLYSTTQAMQRARTLAPAIVIPAAAAAANAYHARTARPATARLGAQQLIGPSTVSQRAVQMQALPQQVPLRYQQLIGWANNVANNHWQSMVGSINAAGAYNYLLQPRQAHAQTAEDKQLFAQFRDPATITLESINNLTKQEIQQLMKDNAIKQNIIDFAAEHITDVHRNTVQNIIKHNPEAAKVFTQAAAQNITQMNLYLLEAIMQHNPEAAKVFTQPAAENITKCKSWAFLLFRIMEHDPEAAKLFTQPVAQNITETFPTLLEEIMKRNPAAAKVFTQAAAQNITKMAIGTLREIMEHNPDAAKLLTQPAVDNITQMNKFDLREIMKRNPAAAKVFTQAAADNIAKMNSGTLYEIMDHNPDAAKAFSQPAAQNITQMEWYALSAIMRHNPEAAKAFTQPAAQNITQIDCYVLCSIMKHNPDAAKVFTQPAAQNITQMEWYALSAIMRHNPEAAHLFAQTAAQNITQMDGGVLYYIVDRKPEYIDKFTEVIIRNFSTIPALTLYLILKYLIEHNNKPLVVAFKRALEKAITSHTNNSFDKRLKQLIYLKYFGGTIIASNSLSQTEQHMIANLDAVLTFIDNGNIPSDFIKPLFEQITKIETDLQPQGYYTFVHGQRWQYHLAEEWYTKLWSLKNRKLIQDYLFAHVKNEPTQAELEQERTTREQLVKDGRIDGASRQKLLFMNYALFGNSTNLGSNSAHYVSTNDNAGNITICLKNAFDYHGYHDVYTKYESELNELKEEHKQLSKYGNLLLIGVPQDKLPECVYLARGGGAKRTINIAGIGKTDNINVIMDTLRTAPEKISDSDQLEFCMAMTWDLALNPESGIKIFSFNAADQEKLAAFNAKSDALFARIKRDICGDDQVETPSTPIKEINIFAEPHPALFL